LLAQARGQQRRANAVRLLTLTRQFDQFQRQGLFRFLNFVGAQQEADVDLEPASVTTENTVQLMSIHQSKGLEFPIVLVADLGKRFNFDDLKERVILDEEFGLCPKVKPPHTGQLYPSLPYWLAKRRQHRESLGEELRLLYVALTRARDKLILSGVASAKTVAEKWVGAAIEGLPTKRILEANHVLDWLGGWLPRATGHNDWTKSGEHSLLAWTIYQEDDERLAGPPSSQEPAGSTEPNEVINPAACEALRKKLEWRYPFAAATTEPAKTSVSALRRRFREETDEEAEPLFRALSFKSQVRLRAGDVPGKLSAADVGTAHHLFLQLVSLERVGTRAELANEAERMSRAGILSGEARAALNLDALLAFWQSELGGKIRAQNTGTIHRELQ